MLIKNFPPYRRAETKSNSYSLFEILKVLFVIFKFSNYLIFKLSHSVLKLSAGFATAAFIALELTVINAMPKVIAAAKAKIHHLISTWYG